jgi:hypothetical protein
MKYLSDFERNGFKAVEIITFLATHGINIEGLHDMPESAPPKIKDFPQWKKMMSLLPALGHAEAAAALADIDTHVPYFLGDSENIELSSWEDIMSRSILAGELIATETGWEDNFNAAPKSWSIKPADLMAWCGKKGSTNKRTIIERLLIAEFDQGNRGSA